MKPIDFLPKRIRHQRLIVRRLRRQGAALVLVVAALALLNWGNERRIANAQAELAVRQADLAQLAQDLEILPELNAQLADGQIKLAQEREKQARLQPAPGGEVIKAAAKACRLLRHIGNF